MADIAKNIPDCLAQKPIVQSDINKKKQKRFHPFCCFLMVLAKAISRQAKDNAPIFHREETEWQLMHGYRAEIDGYNKQLEKLGATKNPTLTTFGTMKEIETKIQSKMALEDELGNKVRVTGGVVLSQAGAQLQALMDLGGSNIRAMNYLINYALQQIKSRWLER